VPNFQVFDRHEDRQPLEPLVTIQKRGTISLNRTAVEMLGAPEAVELLYDRSAQIVGFRAVSTRSPNGYLVRKQLKSSSYIVAGQSFTGFHGIDTTVARQYRPLMYEGDILGIDLSTGIAVVGSGRRAATSQGD
jgi:hypothetical protein